MCGTWFSLSVPNCPTHHLVQWQDSPRPGSSHPDHHQCSYDRVNGLRLPEVAPKINVEVKHQQWIRQTRRKVICRPLGLLIRKLERKVALTTRRRVTGETSCCSCLGMILHKRRVKMEVNLWNLVKKRGENGGLTLFISWKALGFGSLWIRRKMKDWGCLGNFIIVI